MTASKVLRTPAEPQHRRASAQLDDAQRAALMQRIMNTQEHIFELLQADRARAWLEVDLTIQQIKVVFLAVREGSLTAGQISRELGVGFSTVTGLVDRLVEHGLVDRGEDPRDRRATRVTPTDAARELVHRLYAYRRDTMLRLLERVPSPELMQLEHGLASVEAAARDLSDASTPG
jgi:DNA-binding MarR family transcriptional regulator